MKKTVEKHEDENIHISKRAIQPVISALTFAMMFMVIQTLVLFIMVVALHPSGTLTTEFMWWSGILGALIMRLVGLP